MRKVRFALVMFSLLTLAACSKSGKGGSGSPDDLDGLGEGNIPVAQSGMRELRDVNFAFDSAALTEMSQQQLDNNSKYLLENTDAKVVIEGHCDERGTAEYNLALGERRARSVREYLRSLGVKSSQMSVISYGEELPLDPSNTESAWAKNRRAHFALKN